MHCRFVEHCIASLASVGDDDRLKPIELNTIVGFMSHILGVVISRCWDEGLMISRAVRLISRGTCLLLLHSWDKLSIMLVFVVHVASALFA